MASGSEDNHEFGSVSTDLKLALIERYLIEFSKALRPTFKTLWYIDAFAGTGVRTIKYKAEPAHLFASAVEERLERRRGSAQIALDIRPAFDRLTFIEMKKRHYEALLQVKEKHPGRVIDVVREDANIAIMKLVKGRSWAGTRAVMFLDPYGMKVNWETLEAIRKTEAIDVWYLVSLEGLFRQATLDRGKLTDEKRAAITRMVGEAGWEREWYPQSTGMGLLDAMMGANEPSAGTRREATIGEMESYFQRRLASLFPKVLNPIRLKNKGGVETFSLFFAVSNPKPEAWGLATRIANHILKAGKASQVRQR